MLKDDSGLDLGILIELQNWTYSKWSDFKFNQVLKNWNTQWFKITISML